MAQPPPNAYNGYYNPGADEFYFDDPNANLDWNGNFPGHVEGRGNVPTAYPSYPTTPGAAGSPASSYLGSTPDTELSSANASQGLGRKRSFASIGDADVPGSKRASVNASPSLTPGTSTPNAPLEGFLTPAMAYSSNHPTARAPPPPARFGQVSQPRPDPALAMPYRPTAAGPAYGPAFSFSSHVPGPSSARQQLQSWVPGRDYIDLTGDDDNDNDSSPAAGPATPVDRFADLDLLYRPGQPQRPTPADAFDQDFMSQEQLAAFLLGPGDTPLSGHLQPTQNHGVTVPQIFTAPLDDNGDDSLFDDPELEAMLDAPGAGSETLTALISNITPDDVPKEQREQTPARMKSQLKEHQKIALGWMMKKESLSSSKGSLLADEMGLGKTIEALALIVARPSDNPICKTTLIIAPVALMYQWKEEIECHIKSEYPLDVFVYHGNGKKATFDQLRKYDVVLTTFGTLASEYKAKEKDSREDSRTRNEPWPLIARGSMWYRIIMDEAQCIKNRNTLTSKATNDLQAHYRLCMTGTPMMNSVDELYPLIRFLGIRPYNDWSRFRYDISRGIKDKSESLQKKGYDRVRILLKSIMLRREKGTIIDGQPISNIPPKQVVKDMVQFSKDERDLYTAIETKAQIRVNKYLKENMVTNNYANILVMLLRLRQACCHPHLIKDLGVQVSTEGIAEEELMARAHQLGQDVVGRLKNVESGFECPICFDPTVNPTIFVPCGHTCCGECFQKLIDPAAAIGDNGERTTPRCPECRNGLSGERITDYVHFCKVHHREKLQELGIEATEEAESEEEEDDSSDSDDGSLDGFVVPDDADDGFEPLPTSAKGEATGKKKKKKPKKKSKVKGPPKTLAQLKQESLRSAAAKRLYHKRLRKGFESSTKIEKTIAILEDIYANNPEEKTLIFSQWTSLLDLLEIPLVDKKIQYQRYDGSMTMEDRAAAVGKFMKNADQRVMIMSLKAGNAGLNLTEASHVIILDPFWNPFIEDQAVGRVYRMHQTRQVHVHRVLVEDTVEHRICEIQDQKRQMVETALDERAHKSLARLGVGELMYLFGLRDRPPTH